MYYNINYINNKDNTDYIISNINYSTKILF